MTTWEEFEIQCTDFLNQKFGKYAKFIHQGIADSTTPDILVKTKSNNSFYIEVKLSPAQCGQFVLLPNLETGTFEYSNLNNNPINVHSKKIINHMNNNFDAFRESGTSGKNIDMLNSSDIFSEWIIQSYKDKGVKFFITNDFTIFPIEHFKKYFNVTAKYRIKRSGSRNIGKNNINTVMKYILSQNYNVINSRPVKDKLFITSNQELHNQKFILHGFEYMFSRRNLEYELRKLSNTYNANVIFSITLKKSTLSISEQNFINFLT